MDLRQKMPKIFTTISESLKYLNQIEFLTYNLNLKFQKMDNYTIKLNATHSHLKIRLAEIRFDLR